MPKRKYSKRARTSSQSSVEIQTQIQVSKDQTTVTTVVTPHVTTSATSQSNNTIRLVKPSADFLKVLKCSGAEGDIFTLKEIVFYLKEYIGSKQLYDPQDPRIVYCSSDDLGKVFNCDKFTTADVFKLIGRKTTVVEDTFGRWKPSQIAACQPDKRKQFYSAQQQPQATGSTSTTKTSQQPVATGSTSRTESIQGGDQGSCCSVNDTQSTEANTNDSGNPSTVTLNSAAPLPATTETPSADGNTVTPAAVGEDGDTVRKRKKRKKRKSGKSEQSSDSTARKSSWSFTCASDSDNGSFYFLHVEGSDDNASEVLSIQGYETAVVQSSSDDLWFLEDVEIESDGGFSVEYEVESLHSGNSGSSTEIVDSSTDNEEIFVAFQDSDVEFFADLDDSDSDSDLEISPQDKWRCSECDMLNSPLQRCCSRCWKLRPGWLPEQRPKFKRQSYRRSISAPGDFSSPNPSPAADEATRIEYPHPTQSAMAFYDDQSDSDISDIPCKRKKLKRTAKQITKRTPDSLTEFASCSRDVPDGPLKEGTVEPSHQITTTSTCVTNTTESLFSFAGLPGSDDRPANESSEPQQSDPLFTFASLTQQDSGDLQPPVKIIKLGSVDSGISTSASQESNPTLMDLSEGRNQLKMSVSELPNAKNHSMLSNDLSTVCGTGTSICRTLPNFVIPQDVNMTKSSVKHEADGSHTTMKTDASTLHIPSPSLTVDSGIHQRAPHLSLHSFDWRPINNTASLLNQPGVASKSINIGNSVNNTASSHAKGSVTETLQKHINNTSVSNPKQVVSTLSESQMCEVVPSDQCQPSCSTSHKPRVVPHGDGDGNKSSSSSNKPSQSGRKDREASNSRMPANVPTAVMVDEKPGPSRQNSEPEPNYNDMCVICLSRPKDSSIVHGKTGHQICCYSCAKRLRRRGKPCPVCRRPIQKVIKNFLM